MFGLNSDFALESNSEEDIPKVTLVTDSNFNEMFFEDPTPGKAPELKEDLDVIIQIKNKINDLEYLRQDVNKAGGMNGSFAMEAAALIPGFFNDDLQPGFFTTDISKTQYKATLEAIEEAKASLISRIIAALGEMISKAVAWLKQLYANITKRGVNEESLYVYENINKDDVKGPLTKLTAIIINPENEINSLKARTKSNFKDINTDAFFTYLEQHFNVLQKEINGLYTSVNSSRLSRAVVFKPEILNLCFVAASEETRTLHAFKVLYDFALSLGNGLINLPKEGGKVTNEIYEKSITDMVSKIKIASINLTPSEALVQVKAILDEVQDQTVDVTTTPLIKLLGCYSNLFSIATAKEALKKLDQSADEFSNFQKLLQQRSTLKLTGSPSDIEQATKLLHKLSKEFNDQFVLRLNYGSLLNSYVNTGNAAGVMLKRFNKVISTSVGGMDETFQTFIKAYFSGGYPNFFTKRE